MLQTLILGFYRPYCQRHQQATCLERACGWGSFGCVVVGPADLLSVDSDPQPFRSSWLLYAQHCCECFAYVNSLHPHNSEEMLFLFCFQTRSLRPKRLHPTQARIGGGGQGQVRNPVSYHTDPWFSQILLRFSAVGKGIRFVIATPHPDYNTWTAWFGHVLFTHQENCWLSFSVCLLIFALCTTDFAFRNMCHPCSGSNGYWSSFLSSSCQPVYPEGDISGMVVSLGSDSSPKTQGSDLVSNCIWLYVHKAFTGFVPPEQLTKGLVEGFISRPQLQRWSRDICLLRLHGISCGHEQKIRGWAWGNFYCLASALRMWGNQIGDEGAKAFAEALRNHPSLTNLR